MRHFRKAALVVLTVLSFATGWLVRGTAQPNAAPPPITCFSHDRVDATFAKALATTGSLDLFARKDRQGTEYAIHANSRGKADEGVVHSHEVWTGVVVIMSGAATFHTPGKAGKALTADKFGGQMIGGGESHRVSKGDVVIIPPNAPHFYKDIEEPFRYLVIATP